MHAIAIAMLARTPATIHITDNSLTSSIVFRAKITLRRQNSEPGIGLLRSLYGIDN